MTEGLELCYDRIWLLLQTGDKGREEITAVEQVHSDIGAVTWSA